MGLNTEYLLKHGITFGTRLGWHDPSLHGFMTV